METMAFFQVRLFTVQCVCWCWWLPSGPRLEGPPRGVVVRPYYWYDSNTITVRSCVAHLDGSLHKWCARCFHNWLLSSRGKRLGLILVPLHLYLNSLVRSVTLFTTPLHSTSCQCWKWENTSTCLLPVIHENGLAAAAPGGARPGTSKVFCGLKLSSTHDFCLMVIVLWRSVTPNAAELLLLELAFTREKMTRAYSQEIGRREPTWPRWPACSNFPPLTEVRLVRIIVCMYVYTYWYCVYHFFCYLLHSTSAW